jgi:hypothetical protein
MYRWLNNAANKLKQIILLRRRFYMPMIWTGLFVSTAILASCEFADLRQIEAITNLSGNEDILAERSTPVWVRFNTEMDKPDVERLLSVTFADGKVEGDLHWEDNTIYFVPVAGWTPGVRYVLSMDGTLEALDSRDFRVMIYAPFYAVNRSEAPYIKSYAPPDGSSVGVRSNDGAQIKLVFSTAMEKRSVEDNVMVDGISNKIFEWNSDATELTITSNEALNAWATYRWSIGKKALSDLGVPLVKEVSGQFTTDSDIVLPKVARVFPVLKTEAGSSGYVWSDTGLQIEDGLGPSQGIAVRFSKKMDNKSAATCLRFDPAIAGITDQIDNETIVFVPNSFLSIGTLHRLIVSGDTKDAYGLKIGSDYVVNFIADIPYLQITKIELNGITKDALDGDLIQDGICVSVPVISGLRELKCLIGFSLPIRKAEDRLEIVRNIRFETFFPDTLAPVALSKAEWLAGRNQTLQLDFAGILVTEAERPAYFKLFIPGGASGISNGEGSHLKESLTVYLEVN